MTPRAAAPTSKRSSSCCTISRFASLKKPTTASNAGMSGMSGMTGSMKGMGGMGAAATTMDLNDVVYDAFLANDQTLDDPEVVHVEAGGRVLLRIINGASASNLDRKS